MADQIFQTVFGNLRYKDMGDGTFALVESVVIAPPAPSGDGADAKNVPMENEALLNSNQPGVSGVALVDRARANLSIALLPSGVQVATYTSPDQVNYNGHALDVILDATGIGTATLTVAINAKDPASGKYYNLLTGAVINTISTNVYKIGPALAAVANLAANAWVPRVFQVVVAQAGTGNATYSVGYNLGE